MTYTYTYAIMEISAAAYHEIRTKLEQAGYADQITKNGELDMHGIALAKFGTKNRFGEDSE